MALKMKKKNMLEKYVYNYKQMRLGKVTIIVFPIIICKILGVNTIIYFSPGMVSTV